MLPNADVPRKNERRNTGRENYRGYRGQRRGQRHTFDDAGALNREVATHNRMIVTGVGVIVMVAVECFFKSRGMLVSGDVVMPLRQVKGRDDEAGPREHQPQEGHSRGKGSESTHSIDAMSRLSSRATGTAGIDFTRGTQPRITWRRVAEEGRP